MLLTAALDLILPPRCMGCGEIVLADDSFCTACWSSLAFITPPLCDLCGDPFELPREAGALCGACLAAPPRFAARAVVAYDGAAKDVVLGLKHADRDHLARAMARQLARTAPGWLEGALVVPVPLHRWRLWRRGYNQAALIARALSRHAGAELLVDGLERRRATPPSQGMNRKQRAANVRAAFRVPPERRDNLKGRRVVLVDDVLTTGATADACARTLLHAGAESVNLLAWARVVRRTGQGHIGR